MVAIDGRDADSTGDEGGASGEGACDVIFLGDPDDLQRIAVRLEADAQRLRDAATAAVRAAQEAHWVSTSAGRYREVVHADAGRADAIAADLDRAAKLLRAHADQVRDTTAKLARLERSTVDWLQRQVMPAWVSPAQEALVPGLARTLRTAVARAGELAHESD